MNLIDTDILVRLGRYRFLTIAQMARMAIANEKTIRLHLKELETARFVGKQHFHAGASTGKLPNIYRLTPKGAKILNEGMAGNIKAPKPDDRSAYHLPHRILTVDTLIAADAYWDGVEFDTYMQWQGGRPTTSLHLGHKQAVSDGIIRMVDSSGKERVYVLEVYCSEERARFSRKQLEPYLHARDVLDTSLGIPADGKAARILVVCDSSALRDRTISRLLKREGLPPLADAVWDRLHFKTPDELTDFGQGWQRVDGSVVNLPV